MTVRYLRARLPFEDVTWDLNYSYYKGTPAPLTNGGLNEHGVAVRDIWSPSRPELIAMTPPDQSGPNYSDLSRIVLERATSAKDGVRLMGELIARYGHASSGSSGADLTLVIVAHMMRMTRAAIIGVLGSSYVEMAKLKGSPPLRVVLRHALPNALAPIASVVAFNLAYLIVGAVIIETVFVYPGIGQALVDAVRARDVPVVQACALLFAVTYIVLNLIADLIAIGTNPRLMHPR